MLLWKGAVKLMSEKELAIQLLENVPKYKLGYVIAYLQGITADEMADDSFCEKLNKEFAWDPDFTKVTPDEAKRIEAAENSGYVDADEINWEKIGIDE